MVGQIDFSFDWDLSSRELFPKAENKSQEHTKTKNHHHEHKTNKEDLCAVCLNVGEDTMLLPCMHQFHGKCILRWVDQNFSCPLCRQEIGQFVPLNTTDKKIRQQFVDIWERHHYSDSSGSKKKQTPPTDNDDFSVSKTREISLSQVAEIEQVRLEPKSVEIASGNSRRTRRIERKEQKKPEAENILSGTRIREIAENIVETSEVQIRLDFDESRMMTNFAISLSPRNSGSTFVFHTSGQRNLADGVVKLVKRAGKHISKRIIRFGGSLLPSTESEEEHQVASRVSLSIPRPTLYKLNESLEAGFVAGFLTASMLSAATRPVNLYPIVRQVVPNVAIFFTAYEDLKYRCVDPRNDTEWDCFFKKTLCAGAAATLGHLPQNRFKCTVPIRFGLQFGFFEFFKDRCCEMQGEQCKDHSKLSPLAIAASACSGGVIAATFAFPVELYMKYMEVGKATYISTYQTFMRKFLPGCVFTALSFEFGRRWIHKQEVENDN